MSTYTTEPKTIVLAEGRPRGFEERHFVGQLLIRGYGPAAISLKFYGAFGRHLERPWLDRLHRRIRASGKLRRIGRVQEGRTLSTGLAMKSERIQRLVEYVEAIELMALHSPSKVGIEYRRGIEQIKQEVEGLGLDITIHPADAWGQLLEQIRELGVKRADMEHASVGAGTLDAPAFGDRTE